MRQKHISFTMATADRNGISAAQQLAAAGDVLLNGALSAGYDRNGLCAASTPTAAGTMSMDGALATSTTITRFATPRYIIIYSDGDDSGVTFTITGTDFRGHEQYDTVTGPNTTATRSALKFKTVTNVRISGAGTGNIEVGSMGVGTMDVPRHVSIYCAGNMSGVTFTVYGTNRYGSDITEAITGPNATTVNGNKNFKTIERVAASGAVGTDIEVGSADELESQWIPLSREDVVGIGVALSSGASMTYSVHKTYSDIRSSSFTEDNAVALDISTALTDATTTISGSITSPVVAVRLEIVSFVSGTATLSIIPRA